MTESNQTADLWIEHARQVLAGYDRGQWSDALNVVGHLAGAVRQLLEVIGEQPGAGLTDEQRAVLGHALGDAIAWHSDPDPCGSCEYVAPALCAEHAEAVAQRDAYIKLSRQLGLEVRS
jgi:hypothetical protein